MQMLHEEKETTPVLSSLNQTQTGEQTQTKEHATPPQVARKRIVSKARYAALLGRKAGVSTFGILLLFFCLLSILTTLFALIVIRTELSSRADFILFPIFTSAIGIGALYLGHLGRRTIQEAKQIDTGVPLTRANIAHLPDQEGLVRASAEPMQAQKAVLLRAAAEGRETPPEQLVRAVNEQE